MYNEGYGIPYTIEENKLRFLIASRNSCPFTSSFRMKEAIMKSIQEIHQLISQNSSSSKL